MIKRNNNATLTRRNFLRTTTYATAALLPWAISSKALGKAGQRSANDRIVVGCIGVGPRGRSVLNGFLRSGDAQVVAVCDVKTTARKVAKRQVQKHYNNPDCAGYNDFRDLLAQKDIDAVLIATCDHWHVLTAIAAAKAGKDMYVEKPMGLSMAECIALRKTIHRYNRLFQFGTQQRSDRKFRHACEIARNERIGKLHTVNVWSPGSSSGGSREKTPVPDGLDYNLWLGPARYVPHTKNRCTNRVWWFVSDYALGFIAGWGIHPLDIGAWGAGEKIDCPVEVEGTGEFPTEGVCDTAMNWRITYKYKSGLTLNFAGNPRPDKWSKRYLRTSSHGTAFEGSDGWVHVNRGVVNTGPEELVKTKIKPEEIQLYKSPQHQQNLLDCIRTRRKPVCNIDEAVRSETLCQIGEIAIRLKRKLSWDPKTERFKGDDQANRMLSRAMRSPWTL